MIGVKIAGNLVNDAGANDWMDQQRNENKECYVREEKRKRELIE